MILQESNNRNLHVCERVRSAETLIGLTLVQDWDDMFDRIAEAKRSFLRYDRDGSGYIDRVELHMCLLMNGVYLWPWQVSLSFSFSPSRLSSSTLTICI